MVAGIDGALVGVVNVLVGVVSVVEEERDGSSEGDGEGGLGWTRQEGAHIKRGTLNHR